MANGSAVDRIVPPELLSESLPFPMSLCTSREKSRHDCVRLCVQADKIYGPAISLSRRVGNLGESARI
jgi:hypothetical protein